MHDFTSKKEFNEKMLYNDLLLVCYAYRRKIFIHVNILN